MRSKKPPEPEYMRYSGETFAKDNQLLYVPTKVHELKLPPECQEFSDSNPLLLAENRFMILHPPNDGLPTLIVDFYRRAKKGRYVRIMDNHHAFKEITNLPEILLQIAKLYEKHIDDPIFLDPMCFAVALTDQIGNRNSKSKRKRKRYHGKGALAITADTLCNNKVPPEKQNDARKVFYNEFLDHFIGWNFGKAVEKSDELKDTLANIIRLLNERSLREKTETGFGVWISKDVWHVKYDNDGTPKVVPY